ncbi:MAG: hypothetical protein O7C75_20120 [Verrucomicrobia bacterium]|nr:hypothetical protein [Verrucomicrobiota bacterium]
MKSRMIRKIFLVVLLALVSFIAGQTTSAQGQGQTERYFPETRHWMSGELLEFYQSNPFPEFVYGYPFTEAFIDPLTGLRTQYLQRARFEYHPENSPGKRVVLSPLGAWIYKPGEPVDITPNNPACRVFDGSPIQVCYSFLDFYLEYGGSNQFGLPISGLEIHGNRIMQFFERARIEWYPESRPGSQITLGNLGEVYFVQSGENDNLREILKDRILPQTDVTELRIHTFLDTAVITRDDTQTIFVTVYDQNLEPVPQAQVTYIVKYENGDILSNLLPSTDELGLTKQTFSVNASEQGIVEIYVTVTYINLSRTLQTSFRIWW